MDAIAGIASMTLEEIKHRFKDFMDGVRVVMLIDRGIMNSNKGSKRWINKIITTNPQEFEDAVSKLLALQEYLGNPDIRLYSCVNDRKLKKAINLFNHKQLDILPEQELYFYSHINNSFCSCLMKPENKNSKYFLLDVDTKDTSKVDSFLGLHLINPIFIYPSKSGWHYIVRPFNTSLSHDGAFAIQKDGLLLLNYLEGNHG